MSSCAKKCSVCSVQCTLNATPNTTMNSKLDTTQSQSNSPISTNRNPISPTTRYATVAESDVFPKKDQTIIIESRPDIPLDEYTAAVRKLIGANSIRFASRMSHGRICMFLDSKQTADDLTEKHTSIIVQKHILELSPLVTKFKRLILSNVCPVVPHSIIKTALENVGITTTYPITFLRAGLSNSDFTHILSFRRQVYNHPEKFPNIPGSLQINYDDTSYWIYLSTVTLACFLCKKSGHIAKSCTAAQQKKQMRKQLNQLTLQLKNHHLKYMIQIQTFQTKISQVFLLHNLNRCMLWIHRELNESIPLFLRRIRINQKT